MTFALGKDMDASINAKILLSAMAANAVPDLNSDSMLTSLKEASATSLLNIQEIARTFHKPQLLRELQLSARSASKSSQAVEFDGSSVTYGPQKIGRTTLLFKSSLPNELQARLTIESAIERFLNYLLKQHQIIVLNESDRHVQVFIPGQEGHDFTALWESFIKNVAFSSYGNTRLQLPGLVQTFVAMLNGITLSARGFSTLDVPVITKDQANVMAAWYLAVVQQVWQRQLTRQEQIDTLQKELKSSDIADKERQSKTKELEDKKAMQEKEKVKYQKNFEKSFGKFIDKQCTAWEELSQIETQLKDVDLSVKDARKLQHKQTKIKSSIIVSESFLAEKQLLLREVGYNPFDFVLTDQRSSPDKFQAIAELAKRFKKKATEQINSTRGDIFTQCIIEMHRLMALENGFDSCPPPLLSEKTPAASIRLPGDDSKQFCYACGVGIAPKTAQWQVLRFMFERPSQRRQSSSGEGRPYICASCAALAFVSPLKVTDESIILKLEPKNKGHTASLSTQDYVRMLSNKETHISSGKYLIITSDRTNKGDLAAPKLGQVQYAMAKISSIFPQEVLADFKFQLVLQGCSVELKNRHLLFIKGVMESYGQYIITAGKDINMELGGAIRYIQQDSPYLADYSLVKVSSIGNQLTLEKTRTAYWKEIKGFMDSNSPLSLRAKRYRDVAALTGLNYAFIESLEKTAKKSQEQKKDSKYTAREVSKIIEKTDEAYVLGYYATLGDEEKKSVQARLFRNASNAFIADQLLDLLKTLGIQGRELECDTGKYIQLYIDDVQKAYEYFASQPCYSHEKGWKELTYSLKLSLYTRFPELVRKLKSTDSK